MRGFARAPPGLPRTPSPLRPTAQAWRVGAKRTEQAWGASWWRSVRHAGLEGPGRHGPSLSSPGRHGGLSKTGSPSWDKGFESGRF